MTNYIVLIFNDIFDNSTRIGKLSGVCHLCIPSGFLESAFLKSPKRIGTNTRSDKDDTSRSPDEQYGEEVSLLQQEVNSLKSNLETVKEKIHTELKSQFTDVPEDLDRKVDALNNQLLLQTADEKAPQLDGRIETSEDLELFARTNPVRLANIIRQIIFDPELENQKRMELTPDKAAWITSS